MLSFISKPTFVILSVASLAFAAPTARQSGTFTGQATFFNTGLGSCGITNTDSDLIAAVPASLFDSFSTGNPNTNPLCNKRLSVTFDGIAQTVTAVDRCPGCGPSDLDLSIGAFQKFSSLDAGRLSGVTWTIL